MTKYTVYSASGNPTALVWELNQSDENRKEVNNEIMAQNPMVEQVGFLTPNGCGIVYPGVGGTTMTGNFSLKMAGGEFCGNAARCAIYAYLRGEEGTINLSVSGAEHSIRGGLRILEDGSKEVWCEMPVIPDAAQAISENGDGTIVRLRGISHLVVDADGSKPNTGDMKPEELKTYAFELLKKHRLNEEPAAGVIFITGQNRETSEIPKTGDTAKIVETEGIAETAEISILPVVYVRDVDTLFCETACGTGTTAVALACSAKRKSGFQLTAMQPFGETLTVDVEYSEGTFTKVILKGPVKELPSQFPATAG